jgi:hypothetical protein
MQCILYEQSEQPYLGWNTADVVVVCHDTVSAHWRVVEHPVRVLKVVDATREQRDRKWLQTHGIQISDMPTVADDDVIRVKPIDRHVEVDLVVSLLIFRVETPCLLVELE